MLSSYGLQGRGFFSISTSASACHAVERSAGMASQYGTSQASAAASETSRLSDQSIDRASDVWTRRELRAILKNYHVEYDNDDDKMRLLRHLETLIQKRHAKGLRTATEDRDRILRIHAQLAEVARYALSFDNGNVHSDFHNFLYVAWILDNGPLPENKTLESHKHAINRDLSRYSIAYKIMTTTNSDDNSELVRLLENAPILLQNYGPEAVNYFMSRFLPKLHSAIKREGRSNLNEREGARDAFLLDESDPFIMSSIVCDTKSTRENQAAEIARKRNRSDGSSSEEEESLFPSNKRTRLSTSCPESSATPQTSQRAISPTPEGYTTTTRRRCPKCGEIAEVVKERYHVPTICKS